MSRLMLAILMIAAFGCKPESNTKQPELLPESQMVEIIKDIQLLEAAHKDIGIFGQEKKSLSDTSYAIVFNQHGVKASEFDSSYRYYLRNPIEFEQLMLKVERSLNLNP